MATAVFAAQSSAQPDVIELSSKLQSQSLGGRATLWIDETGRASLEQAMAALKSAPPPLGASSARSADAAPALSSLPSAPVKIFKSGQAYNLHDKAMWLHFKVSAPLRDNHWHLQSKLATLDSASLYFQRKDGSWVWQQSGDSIAHSQWSVGDRFPLFSLSETTDTPVDYWLRISHQRLAYSADISLISDEEVMMSRQLENLLLGAYFGLMLAVAMVCVVNGVVLQYGNYLRYAVYVAVICIAQMAYIGLMTQYLTPNAVRWNAVSSFVLPFASVLVAMWWVRGLVSPARLVPKFDRLIKASRLVFAAVLVFDAFSPSVLGYKIANFFTLYTMFALHLMLWFSWRAGDRNVPLLALGFAPIVLAALFPILRNFGVIQTGFLSQYSVILGSAVQVPLLLYALSRRTANQRDMLAREQALSQRDAVTGLAGEKRLLAKIATSQERAQSKQHKLGLLHVQLRNHDELANAFGTQASNSALLLTASYLRRVCRDVDLAARIDGANFVVLIEGPVEASHLTELATQILANSLRHAVAVPPAQLPKIFINMALLPDKQTEHLGSDAIATLTWITRQSNLANLGNEPSAKKAIRALNF